MIGIIGAMEEEVADLVSHMEVASRTEKGSLTFVTGKLKGKEVVVVRAGIGKVNAAICTQMLIDSFGVEVILNTGIAGSLDARINIGDVVVSSDVLQHDVDATNFGYPLGQIPRMEVLSFPADEKLARLAAESCKRAVPEIDVYVGRIVSGDQFISSKAVKQRIIENFGGLATEMEGAAIGQAAYVNGVPFVVLRAISDKADDSACEDYPAFEAKAIAHMVLLTEEFVKSFDRT